MAGVDHTGKIANIIRQIEDTRVLNDTRYLATSRFVVFLLFGANEDQLNTLARKAKSIIYEPQACVFIAVTNPAGVVDTVYDAIKDAGNAQIRVSLIDVDICPVIIGGATNADCGIYSSTVLSLDEHLSNKWINAIWKPFLLLGDDDEVSRSWLDTISDAMQKLGTAKSCRCCVMSRFDEQRRGVIEERLFNNILLVAFLHSVDGVGASFSGQIQIGHEDASHLFYTAQTVFVANPVLIRTLTRMRLLLEKLKSVDNSGEKRDIDMTFINGMLMSQSKKMPRVGGRVSLTPLYSVMPEPRNTFKDRLKEFVNNVYLTDSDDETTSGTHTQSICAAFLKSFVEAGKTVADLESLVGDSVKTGNLSLVHEVAIDVENLPELPKNSGIDTEAVSVYMSCARALQGKIRSLGKDQLESFFRSNEFVALPRKYHDAVVVVDDVIRALESAARRQEVAEINLPLLNNPDEAWINAINISPFLEKYTESFCMLILDNSDENARHLVETLLDMLYAGTRQMNATDYMQNVSQTCDTPHSPSAGSCVMAVRQNLLFPVQLSHSAKTAPSNAYVVSHPHNGLTGAWEQQADNSTMPSSFLPTESDERFVVLRMSSAFGRDDIQSVARISSTVENTPVTTAEPQLSPVPQEREPEQEAVAQVYVPDTYEPTYPEPVPETPAAPVYFPDTYEPTYPEPVPESAPPVYFPDTPEPTYPEPKQEAPAPVYFPDTSEPTYPEPKQEAPAPVYFPDTPEPTYPEPNYTTLPVDDEEETSVW